MPVTHFGTQPPRNPLMLLVFAALLCTKVCFAASAETCPTPDVLLQMANAGDRSAQFLVGKHLLGSATPDAPSAVEWMQRAAGQGLVAAQALLGVMYLDGKNVAKDPVLAGKWLLRAGEQGNKEAQSRLQEMYTDGIGVPKDRFEATQWKLKAASEQDWMRITLAAAVSPAPARAGRASLSEYLPYAEQGSSLAQYAVGRMYFDAPYGQRDERLGVDWIKKAAEQGHPQAMLDLASILALGANGVDRDQQQALDWFRATAKENDRLAVAAMFEVSFKLGRGRGIALDEQESFFWMRQVADMGFAAGQGRLAWMFATGTGVAQDYAQAATWYQRSAEQGNAQSQYELARLYLEGKGVPANANMAYFWWALSAKGGNSGGELGAAGYWDDRSVSDRSKMDEEVRHWKPTVPAVPNQVGLPLEKLCEKVS